MNTLLVYLVVAALLLANDALSVKGAEISGQRANQRRRRQMFGYSPYYYNNYGPGLGLSGDLMAAGMGLEGLGELGYAARMLF
ncbi:unnamed protein product [Soboliphyme baturini]|uniref:Uncharacterized protein n=1 Tax=Soboliphyme baturini TaxID=241478 RepID=A0A183J7V0_9BILA|nr:unnamed protein product [Soboliphyme baturini]